jgi:hypothetical protein
LQRHRKKIVQTLKFRALRSVLYRGTLVNNRYLKRTYNSTELYGVTRQKATALNVNVFGKMAVLPSVLIDTRREGRTFCDVSARLNTWQQ